MTYQPNGIPGCTAPGPCPPGWYGLLGLDCGESMYVRYDQTDCSFSYSCDGVLWIAVGRGIPDVFGCNPFSDGPFLCNMDDINAGCAPGLCGNVTVTLSE